MNNIQIEGVDSNFSQVVLDDIQNIKKHLSEIIASSDRTIIENLINETKSLLEQAVEESKTYKCKEIHDVFVQLSDAWFKVRNHYKNTLETTERLNNFLTAYSYFFWSLAIIHENRTSEEKIDFTRTVSGFLLLSEVVDVFIEYLPFLLLKHICDWAKSVIYINARIATQYLKDNSESSHLITQINACCSLIILRVEERVKNTDSPLETEATQLENKIEVDASPKPWWEQIAGTFADNPAYNEAMRLGCEYRNSNYSEDTELTDV